MCGIAGFLFRTLDQTAVFPDWLRELAKRCHRLELGPNTSASQMHLVETLAAHFDSLMSCSTALAVAENSANRAMIEQLADGLRQHQSALIAHSEAGHTEVDPIIEGLRDMDWQLREELIGAVERTLALLGLTPRSNATFAAAYAVEHVLSAIDKLEVRGRDSAGITILATVGPGEADAVYAALAEESQFAQRHSDVHAGDGAVSITKLKDGRGAISFVYKTANLIGRLGENCAALRKKISADELLWRTLSRAQSINILAHTRWASSGIISVANCHPHNASITGDKADEPAGQWIAALNGDVDNHTELAAMLLRSPQRSVDPQITTDAKIIPIGCRFFEADVAGQKPSEVFERTVRRLDGSMAIAMLHALTPDEVMIAQKGSGQGMHMASVADGWFYASEAYGLASLTRQTVDLANHSFGGILARAHSANTELETRLLHDGSDVDLVSRTLQVYARDIYRGDFETFLEKEIHDAPVSVAKTLRGRFKLQDNQASFDGLPSDIWASLRDRLQRGVERVYVIGQGTAGVAADGIAYFVEKALRKGLRSSIEVRSLRSSELSAEIDRLSFKNALVIAVSQSGTTTDTNRAVDLAIERGAFVHCIVNRRGSDLARKAHSVLYTSDGRDIEMSVASTKAFYTQLVAGKLTALFMADTRDAITSAELTQELRDLQSLPEMIARMLDNLSTIQAAADAYAPRSRYWAVVGSGANHIPAKEIRIKLSELCYKSIPVDYTEDKKHIDLSTEPLTLVIAAELEPELYSDLIKEVAIFRAHNGNPIVFATEGSDAEGFREHSRAVIALPAIGSGLSLVLAAVAGHLFGLFAARAIDRGAQSLRLALNVFGRAAETGNANDLNVGVGLLDEFLRSACEGDYDSGLRSRDIASVALWRNKIRKAVDRSELDRFIAELRAVYEETSRTVDTIRHQAKTVTVGTSRPQDVASPVVRDALSAAEIHEVQLKESDRLALSAISRLIEMVPQLSVFYVEASEKDLRLRFARGNDEDARTQYVTPCRPTGVLGASSDTLNIEVSRTGDNVVVVLPFYSDDQISVAGFLQLKAVPRNSAPTEHKLAVLRALGHYQELLRYWEQQSSTEVSAETALVEEIAFSTPMIVLTEHFELRQRNALKMGWRRPA